MNLALLQPNVMVHQVMETEVQTRFLLEPIDPNLSQRQPVRSPPPPMPSLLPQEREPLTIRGCLFLAITLLIVSALFSGYQADVPRMPGFL